MEPTTVTAPAPNPTSTRKLIAPWWHTLLLIIILLGLSAGQANKLSNTVERHGKIPLYISTIVVEWILVGIIWLAVRKRGLGLKELIGGRWSAPEDALLDLAIAAGAWLVVAALAVAIAYILKLNEPQKIKEMRNAIDFLVPHSALELGLWVALSVTAGFCEEIIFRGYFQRQFSAITGSALAGVFLQAVLFGGGHGYEGWQRMIIIVMLGFIFGLVAWWRKSLRPVMMAHAWQDLLAGIGSRLLSG